MVGKREPLTASVSSGYGIFPVDYTFYANFPTQLSQGEELSRTLHRSQLTLQLLNEWLSLVLTCLTAILISLLFLFCVTWNYFCFFSKFHSLTRQVTAFLLFTIHKLWFCVIIAFKFLLLVSFFQLCNIVLFESAKKLLLRNSRKNNLSFDDKTLISLVCMSLSIELCLHRNARNFQLALLSSCFTMIWTRDFSQFLAEFALSTFILDWITQTK